MSRRVILFTLLAVGCSSPDFEAGHEHRIEPTSGLGVVHPADRRWLCKYTYIPADGWKDGLPCLPPMREENLRSGQSYIIAQDPPEAVYKFRAYVWPNLVSWPGMAEHGATLVSVTCERG